MYTKSVLKKKYQPNKNIASLHNAPYWQSTVAKNVSFQGVGVHTGNVVNAVVAPAGGDDGIIFVRTDLDGSVNNIIPASWDRVSDTNMSTTISNDDGVYVSTVEHLMAALFAAGINNAIIYIDGPEVPIMDGSSACFLEKINQAGCTQQVGHFKKTIKILQKLQVSFRGSFMEIAPSKNFKIDMQFDFKGRFTEEILPESCGFSPNQNIFFQWDQNDFVEQIASARTFGFYEDAQKLWAMGMAKGASLDNSVVIKDNKILNQDGLRFADEFVRHKILDLVGDLSLAGGLIHGHIKSINPGHHLNNLLLREIFNNTQSFCFI